jgi:hypothetical protein
MVIYVTISNMSFLPWCAVSQFFLAVAIRRHGETTARHITENIYLIKLYKTDLIRAEIELTTLAMIENDYIRRYTFNYHTITDTKPHLTYSKIEINCGMF